jgi:alkylhydroperoxidase family enzyme
MRIREKKAKAVMVNIASLFSRKQFGTVIAPLRTVYATQPALLGMVTKIVRVDKKLSLPTETKRLISTFVATLNNCPFCADLNLFVATQADVEKRKLKVPLNFRNEPAFSDKEKAALAYCEEVTLTKSCTDACFSELQRHFNEKEIVEITWLNAVENYFNLIAKPLQIPSDGLSNGTAR